MPDGGPRTPDPPFTGRFVFSVDGVVMGSFTEVSGLEVRMEVFTIAEGGNNAGPIRMPGPVTWPNLVLKRGITEDDHLFAWLSDSSGEGLDGKGHVLQKRGGSVVMMDSRHRPVRTWTFRDAMPVRWNGPQFAAGGNALATEELEVSHGGFTSS
ncbi:phage tail protein [Propionibacteriaceae bacterium Y2011]|uniref:phage tail protein n=1 Tax=Microlunatus sp. Y2014 TaxID=3418488 RepID=UPI003B44A28F